MIFFLSETAHETQKKNRSSVIGFRSIELESKQNAKVVKERVSGDEKFELSKKIPAKLHEDSQLLITYDLVP